MANDAIDIVGSIGLHSYEQAKFEKANKSVSRFSGTVESAENEQGKELSVKKQEEIRKAATQFEALLLQQMLKSMWASVPNEGVLGGSREEEYYRDMLNEGLAESLAERQSIGIRDIIIKDLSRLEKGG